LLENKYLILAVMGIISVVAVSGCTSQNTSANTVTIQNTAFNPATLNVQVGTTVTWINKDSVTHRVVSDTGLFSSGDLTTGMSYNYTFNQTGSYPYHCSIHPSMTGTIVVSTNAPATQSNNNPSPNNSAGSGIKY
jgi:plastocyanin